MTRTQTIECHLPMAASLARRFSGRGEPLADLTQVAVIGLIKAVDRYDASRGVAFESYAIPTILGEIKRHFRDATWNVRVPRRLQELGLRLTAATETLTHELKRSPTAAELASHLGVSQSDVLAAQLCVTAYRPISIDQPLPNSQDQRPIDLLGEADPDIAAIGAYDKLRVCLASLSKRDQRIIALRYVAEMTQSQIAADLGVSQMHISRLLADSLARLREGLVADPGTRRQPPTQARRDLAPDG